MAKSRVAFSRGLLLVLGVALQPAMILTPAIVASSHRSKSDDDEGM